MIYQPTDRKIKIFRMITRLNIGGPAIHAILLTNGLNKGKFESKLVTGIPSEYEGDMFYLAEKKGVKPTIIPELRREICWTDDMVSAIKLFRLLKRERPHIVHTHTAKAGAIGRIVAKMAGVPIILHTFHGHVFHSYFGSWKTRFFLLMERLLAHFTDRIITVTDEQRREILSYKVGSPRKVVSVPLGLELERFLECEKGKIKRELHIDDHTKMVGIVARLVPVKNHLCFLRSASIVLERCKNVKFLIVGDGELRELLEMEVCNLGLQNDVIFLGFRRDLEHIYADLDVVVLSSLNEGLPVAIIEAMAAGKPVVCTKVGGVPDLVEDGKNGFLVPSDDHIAMADAIVKILDDPHLAEKMGSEGRKKVYPAYTKERLIKDMENLYEELLIMKGFLNRRRTI